jgi:hypothetical protein
MPRLSLALCLLAGCATRLPDGGAPDLAGSDLAATAETFLGPFAWASAQSSPIEVSCDNGNVHNDPPPTGNFDIAAGPAAGQVNIGVGTMACPIFIFDVAGGVGMLTNLGVTCASGPGSLTTRGGTLRTDDGGRTASLELLLDAMMPDGGGFTRCRMTIAGTITRR